MRGNEDIRAKPIVPLIDFLATTPIGRRSSVFTKKKKPNMLFTYLPLNEIYTVVTKTYGDYLSSKRLDTPALARGL